MTQSNDRLAPAMRPRTTARVAAVQALFQIEQGPENPETVIVQFVQHRLGTTLAGESFEDGHVPEADITLFTNLVRRAAAEHARCTALLSEILPSSWPLNRLDPVLRALLVTAIAEMQAPNAPPVNVVINEYLDIAHGFFSGDEPRMVNGVLDTVAKRLTATQEEAAKQENAPLAASGDSSDAGQD